MSSIYSFNAGEHDKVLVLVRDGEIEYAVEEERMNRIKSGDDKEWNFPLLAYEQIYNKTGIKLENADHVTSALAQYTFDLPIQSTFNLKKIPNEKYDHHFAHAASVYYTSGFKDDKVLIITHDGEGDYSYGKVFLAEKGVITEVSNLPVVKYSSAALLYGRVTVSLGWKINKDEGKTVGMAGNGSYDEKIYKYFEQIFHNNDDVFLPPNPEGKTDFLTKHLKKLGYYDTKEQKANIAYNVQLLVENEMIKYMNNIHNKYPEYTKLCLAGGLFANVKLNQKINELQWVDEVYIIPPMGDNGLALGCALHKSFLLGERQIKRLDDVFLGFEYTDEQIEIESKNYNFTREPYIPSEIANELNNGKIIGFFKGRFEYGPRALGARSILVRPTDHKTHEVLNNRLKRDDIMPFAPIVMSEYANDVFYASKSQYTAEFMTMCYTTKPDWVERIPAVIHHIDHSSRPQIVFKERNLHFHKILEEYNNLSHIPVLLNTSFNGHGEPIIDKPSQAFEHLNKGTVDMLVMENYVYKNKNTI
jgi:carbamoyltransferase